MADLLEEIYHAYKKPVYNYFYRSTLDSHTAEELTQDTFLKAFKFYNTFKGESSVKTWLFKIARNTYITYVKSEKRSNEKSIYENEVKCKRDDFAVLDERTVIKKVLYKLSEEERSLIILRDINGFSYSEISKIMDFSEGKVKIGLHRARKKFRNMYCMECCEGGES